MIGVPFGVFCALSLVAALVAFGLWPLFGSPGVEPAIYGMSAEEATADSASRTSYSSLLRFGAPVYIAAYSVWLGLGAAIYSALAGALLLLLSHRLAAMILPAVVYIVQTVIASLCGVPELSLLYSLLPFGLSQSPALVAASPTLVMLAVTAALWVVVFRGIRTNQVIG